MPSHTIKVTGVSDELLRLLDEQIRSRHATGRSEYIRELIRRDVLDRAPTSKSPTPRTFHDLLEPIREQTSKLGETEEESEEFLRGELEAHRRSKRVASRTDPS